MSNKLSISFIGVGRIGTPMVFKLLEEGYSVKVYDKCKSATDKVVASGAVWADTPREAAADYNIVITSLPSSDIVMENMLGENGALAGLKPGGVWIDTSTTNYHNTLHISSVASQKGILSLEAPVSSISHMGADIANTSFYVGGDKEGYEQVKEVLNTISKTSFHVGEIGKAQTVKLLTNLIHYTSLVVAAEILCIAKEARIPLHWMWEFIQSSQGSSLATDQYLPFVFDGSYDNSCTLDIICKDLSLVIELANELEVASPVGRAIYENAVKASARYDGQDNILKILNISEEENNLELRIPGFIAPSKHGVNPDFVHSEGYIEDQFGRIKPELPDSYKSPPFQLTAIQVELAETLSDFLAYVNFAVLEEAYELGQQKGISRELLSETIRWGCGSCWVSDHYDSYQPKTSVLDKMAAIETELHLPVLNKLLETFHKHEPYKPMSITE